MNYWYLAWLASTGRFQIKCGDRYQNEGHLLDVFAVFVLWNLMYRYYCKFRNFRKSFTFASFVKKKSSQNGEITLSFTVAPLSTNNI